jgi:hypothetical protein
MSATVVTLVGGVAVMVAGVVLLVVHQTQVGLALTAAGAAELGVKVGALAL